MGLYLVNVVFVSCYCRIGILLLWYYCLVTVVFVWCLLWYLHGSVPGYRGICVLLPWYLCLVTAVLVFCYCGIIVLLLWYLCGICMGLYLVSVVFVSCYCRIGILLLWYYCLVTVVFVWYLHGFVPGFRGIYVAVSSNTVRWGQTDCAGEMRSAASPDRCNKHPPASPAGHSETRHAAEPEQSPAWSESHTLINIHTIHEYSWFTSFKYQHQDLQSHGSIYNTTYWQ